MTLAVDLHKRVKYETVEERKERTLDFFRRLGPR